MHKQVACHYVPMQEACQRFVCPHRTIVCFLSVTMQEEYQDLNVTKLTKVLAYYRYKANEDLDFTTLYNIGS